MSRLYLSRAAGIAARKIGDEMMVMSGRDSTLFTLNPTATIIWQSADGATPLEDIVEQKICPDFEVESAQALQDAEILARELAGHGILQISSEPIVSPSPVEDRK